MLPDLVDVQESTYSGPDSLPWMQGRALGAASYSIGRRTYHHVTGTRSQQVLIAGDLACAVSTVVLRSSGDAVGEIAYSRQADAYPSAAYRLKEWSHGVPVIVDGQAAVIRRRGSAWSPARSTRRLVVQGRPFGPAETAVELAGLRRYSLRSGDDHVATLSPRFAVRSDADEDHQALAILLHASSAFLAASHAALRVI